MPPMKDEEFENGFAETIAQECSPTEILRMFGAANAGIGLLRLAIQEFDSLGYETDTSDLSDFLSEAEQLARALAKAQKKAQS